MYKQRALLSSTTLLNEQAQVQTADQEIFNLRKKMAFEEGPPRAKPPSTHPPVRVQTSEPKQEGAPVKTELPQQEGLAPKGRKAARLGGPSETYIEIKDEPEDVPQQQQSLAPAVVLQKSTMADARLQTDLAEQLHLYKCSNLR